MLLNRIKQSSKNTSKLNENDKKKDDNRTSIISDISKYEVKENDERHARRYNTTQEIV